MSLRTARPGAGHPASSPQPAPPSGAPAAASPWPQNTTRTLPRPAGLAAEPAPSTGTAGSQQSPPAPRAGDTHRGRDPPAPHARHLEAALLDLLVRQPHLEVELVVAGADDDVASLLGEVGDAGVELEIAVVLEGLRQADELRAQPGGSVGDRQPGRHQLLPREPCPPCWDRAATASCPPYLLLGDLFLQGLQLTVLVLVDEDPPVLDV